MTVLRKNLEIVTDILTAIDTNNGGTIPVVVGQVSPTSGYAVALESRELQISFESEFEVIENAYAYVDGNKHYAGWYPNGYLGVWYDIDSNVVFLDVTLVVPEKAQALELGRENKQISIYDFNKKEVIYL